MSDPPKDDPSRSASERYLRTDHLDADLRRRSARGGAVTLAAQACRLILGLGSTAALARLLTPEDFGLIAMVAALAGFAGVFKDLGLAMATVQKKEVTHDQISTLFWLNVALGFLITLLTAACAPLVAWFYGEPRVTMITVALAAAFTFGGLAAQHEALLRRQMRFVAVTTSQIVSTAAGVIAGIAAALLGAGYWALVVMQLTKAVAGAIGVWVVCGWRPGSPLHLVSVRSFLAFGGNLTAANLLNYVVRNLDNILIGWRWGAGPLGSYTKAYYLLLLPIRQFNAPFTSVAIPALSRLQDAHDRYRLYYRKGVQLLALVGMPLVVFTFVAADKIVLLVLGAQWVQVIPIFRILAPAAFLGTFNVATAWVYVSLGHTRRRLRWTIVASAVTIVAFICGLPWGPLGLAAAFSISTCAVRLPGVLYCFRGTPVRLADLIDALARPALTSTLAGGALFLAQPIAQAPSILVLRLAVDLLLYGIFYAAAWLLIPNGRATIREVLALTRDLRREPAPHDDQISSCSRSDR